jgi:hypothetical protein
VRIRPDEALPACREIAIWRFMDLQPSPLDEPAKAAHAWKRYKRLMRGMALLTLAVIAIALGVLYALGALVSIHFVIATVLGIGVTMMLMAALMGLVFLSSGTGHDESVSDLINRDD